MSTIVAYRPVVPEEGCTTWPEWYPHVAYSTVCQVVQGVTWKHVEGS
jgi:hypothetical protein